VKKKDIGEAYDVNKQTIYIAPKSTHESRAQYSLEPEQGNHMMNNDQLYNTTRTVLWPFFRDYLSQPVAEERLTHPPS